MNHRAICKGLAVITWMLVLQASAFGGCPPQSDAELVAGGGAIVSGRVVQAGPPISASDGRNVQWARLEVTERRAGSAPNMVRLLAVDAGLYTLHFTMGTTGTLAIRQPFGESGVTMCDGRGP